MSVEELHDPGAVPAEDVLARQRARESAARSYARHLPVVPVRAEGMTVYGADGRSYLDCLSGAGSLALGHNHPVAVQAIRKVLDDGAPLHVLDLATPIKDEFTDTLLGLLPAELARDAKLHFCGPTGADAVEAAIKLARIATGRGGLVAFTGAYHGMTAAALAATGDVTIRTPAGVSDAGITRLPFPQDYRCPYGVGGIAGERIAVEHARRLFDDPGSGMTPPAAMIVEPVQGEGGVLPAPDGWLRALRTLAADHGLPLIADEVQTGLGRTGELWGVDHAQVVPDMMVLSKAIGGGLPLAVLVYRGEYDVWQEGTHTGTFRGHQLAMAAGTATMKFIAEHALAERARKLGDRLRDELTEMMADLPAIGDVRGKGLMIGLDLVEPEAAPDALGARPAAPGLARRVRAEALSRGLIVELGGRHGAVLRLLPPLTMTELEADQVRDVLGKSIAAATAALRP